MATQERKITGAIGPMQGRMFRPGDEDALAKVLPEHLAVRLIASGALVGDWGAVGTLSRSDGEPVQAEPLDLTDEERADLPPLDTEEVEAGEVEAEAEPEEPAKKSPKKRATKSTTHRSK